jgi:hypothetical protein
VRARDVAAAFIRLAAHEAEASMTWLVQSKRCADRERVRRVVAELRDVAEVLEEGREPSQTATAIRSKRLRAEKQGKGICINSGCWAKSRLGKVRCEFHADPANL